MTNKVNLKVCFGKIEEIKFLKIDGSFQDFYLENDDRNKTYDSIVESLIMAIIYKISP